MENSKQRWHLYCNSQYPRTRSSCLCVRSFAEMSPKKHAKNKPQTRQKTRQKQATKLIQPPKKPKIRKHTEARPRITLRDVAPLPTSRWLMRCCIVPKSDQNQTKITQNTPASAQNGPKSAQNCHQIAPESCRRVPRRPPPRPPGGLSSSRGAPPSGIPAARRRL